MARFASEDELRTFLRDLDPDYVQYAVKLWEKGIRTPHHLANASRGLLLSYVREICDTAELHIDDIKARAVGTAGAEVEAIKFGMTAEQLAQLDTLFSYVQEQKQKSRKRSIPSLNTEDWCTVKATARLEVRPFLGDMQPKRTQPQPDPFGWDDRQESAQWENYMPYLSTTVPYSGRSYCTLNCNHYPQLLDTPGMADQLGFDFTGTSDVALVLRKAMIMPATGLRMLFELKKHPSSRHVHQAMVTLLLANVHSRPLKPMVVLTDLSNDYTFYWLDNRTIWYYAAPNAATAMGIIADFLAQEQVLEDSSVAAIDTETLLPFAKRRQLPYEPAGGSTSTSLEELASFLSPVEMRSCAVSYLLQELHNIPTVAALHPSRNLFDSMYS